MRPDNKFQLLIKSLSLVNSSLDLQVVLDRLIRVAQQLTGARAASVLLVDEARKNLQFVAATGKKSEEVKKIYLRPKEGIAGYVYHSGRPKVVQDVAREKSFSPRTDRLSGFHTRNLLAVPIKLDKKIIGVLEVLNKSGAFTVSDIYLLKTIASSAALSIHKARLYQNLRELFLAAIQALARAIEAKDPYTRGHSERIRRYSLAIGRVLGLNEKQLEYLEIAALLHDIGKIGIAEEILQKKTPLLSSEYEEIKKHPVIGTAILKDIKEMSPALGGILHHQERFDGSGYPAGLKGKDIPLLARIIAVADAFDAMTSDRPYRQGLAPEKAVAEIKRCSGTQFDPRCVAAFVKFYERDLKNVDSQILGRG